MCYTVYCHTGPSGKRYVGITKFSSEHRWGQHLFDARAGSKLTFHRAIRKYGPGPFTHEILEVVETRSAAVLAEKRWILGLNTKVPSGYNETGGGDGGDTFSGRKHSQSTLDRMSKVKLGNKYAFGTKRSEASRALISKARTKLSPDQAATVKVLIAQGRKYADVASMFGVRPGAIYRIVKPRPRAKLSSCQIAEIKSLIAAEMKTVQIANMFSISRSTVHRFAKKNLGLN